MTWRPFIFLVIPVCIATSAATTAGIWLFQVGRMLDHLADTIAPSDPEPPGASLTEQERREAMEALKEMIHGRAI